MLKDLELLSCEEGLKAVTAEPGGGLGMPSVYTHPSERCREWSLALVSGAREQDRRQWAGAGIQRVPPEHQEALFVWG